VSDTTPSIYSLPRADSSEIALSRLDILSLIHASAVRNNISSVLLLNIAKCESGLNPYIHNKKSTASGLFQFLDSTFSYYAKKYGLEGDKDNPYIQAELASLMIRDGGLSHWYASYSCWSFSKSL